MMTFSAEEIFSSVIFALAYGAIFAVIFSLTVVLKEILAVSFAMLKSSLRYDKIFPLPSLKNVKISNKSGALISVVSIFLFAVGFSLLSYLALDGQLRLYMLILSFASFYLSKIAFSDIFSRVIFFAFRISFILIIFVIRLVLWLPKRIFNLLQLIKNK